MRLKIAQQMRYLLNIQVINNTFKKKFVFFFQVIHEEQCDTFFGKIGKSVNEIFLNFTYHLPLYYKDGSLILHLIICITIKELKIQGQSSECQNIFSRLLVFCNIFYQFQLKMKRRPNSLSVKVKALQSLKRISEDCFDLTSPAFATPTKPLLCQTELTSKNNHFNDISPIIIPQSARVQKSSRPSSSHQMRITSAFDIVDKVTTPQSFGQRIYTSKLMESQSKRNERQMGLFMKRLSKAVSGQTMNISGLQIGPLAIKDICDFAANNHIQQLILDKNNLKDEGIIQLTKHIAKIHLKHLSLASVNMTQKSCNILIDKLQKIQSLDYLDLSSTESFSRNRLHKGAFDMISHITGSKAGHCNLRIFKCAGVGLDDSNFKSLCEGLGRGSRLQYLSIENNQITCVGMAHFKEHAVKLHLKYLDCSNNKIEGGGLIELSSLIGDDYNLTKISKSLKVLKVCKAKIKSYHLSHFAKSMANNQILEQLHLDHNPISEGSKFNYFANFLTRNWTIKKLSFSHSFTSTDDLLLLFDSFEINRGLQYLSISGNKVQLCVFKKMAEVLARNKFLKIIHAESCGIVDSYILKSEELLYHFKHLQEIYFDHNYLTDKSAHILQRMVFKNKTLCKLHLHNNSISIKMQGQIDRALGYNNDAKQFDGPDLTYLKYMQDLQSNQKTNLQQVINELRQKQKALNCRQLLHSIAKRDIQTYDKANQIKRQSAEVTKIAQLKDQMQKMIELEQRAQKNKIAESLLGDSFSLTSIVQMPSISISREVSQNLSEGTAMMASSRLQQTH